MASRRLLLLFFMLAVAVAAPVAGARAEDEPVEDQAVKPAPKSAKKKPAKKKTYDYGKSKYKSREPSQTPTYKFNERGEPIRAQVKKKASAKKNKRSKPLEVGPREGSEACGFEENCAQKKSEADAL